MTGKRDEIRRQMKAQGERLKREVQALARSFDSKGRLKLKIALMSGGASETTARKIMTGVYEATPRQELLEIMEDVLANFGKARAS